MRKRKTLLVMFVLFIAAAAIGLCIQMPLAAQAPEETASSAKLDELLAGQKTILQEIKAIKDELDGIRNQTNKL